MADVLVKERLLRKLERMADTILEREEEYVTEEEAAKFLGISVKTLQNKHAAKLIPASAYRLNILQKRMYQKSKLLINE